VDFHSCSFTGQRCVEFLLCARSTNTTRHVKDSYSFKWMTTQHMIWAFAFCYFLSSTSPPPPLPFYTLDTFSVFVSPSSPSSTCLVLHFFNRCLLDFYLSFLGSHSWCPLITCVKFFSSLFLCVLFSPIWALLKLLSTCLFYTRF
jgi:hypothetical protein